MGDGVGFLVGRNEGEHVGVLGESVGPAVGRIVGSLCFGQLLKSALKEHSAFASFLCATVGEKQTSETFDGVEES